MDGGLRTISSVRARRSTRCSPGPVAGLLGAETYSRELLDGRNLVCLDIGGTSSDLGVILDGRAEVTNEWELEHAIPLAITTLDVRSIGAGGGSLIGTDEVGSLKVGPESAGSTPGPACYGRGGEKPAMTDAYVAMGLLQPELFLAGEMKLDRDAALGALDRSPRASAWTPSSSPQGAYAIANTKIAAAVAAMTTHRGLDPREFSLLAYGAAGPMHGVAVARELGITEVVVPYFPGGFSAFGMIASRSRVEYSQATMTTLDPLSPEELNRVLGELATSAATTWRRRASPSRTSRSTRAFYGMYAARGRTTACRCPPSRPTARRWTSRRGRSTTSTTAASATARRRSRSSCRRSRWWASARGRRSRSRPARTAGRHAGRGPERAVVMRADAHRPRGAPGRPFYDRARLREGDEVHGPAVIDDHLGTIVVNPGAVARVASHGTLSIEV